MQRQISRGVAAGLALLGLSLLLPGSLRAQQVQGRLLDEVDARPLAGAHVVLLLDGSQVAGTVTRVDGGFRLTAPEPGSYTLRAEHLGYAVVERSVAVPPPGEAVRVELTAVQQAIELEGLVAEVDGRCDIPRPVAVQVATLWDEVSKAFQVAALVEEQQLYDLRLERWQRSLEPRTLRVVDESRRPGRGIRRGSPFQSLPPDDLAQNGYIREDAGGGLTYYAPDARVLLSSSFQDTHCFGVTIDPPGDGENEWVGIRFEPRHGDRPDVRGVLWIDGVTLQPQRLDYGYTELPGRVGSRDLGGRVSFQRLPAGPWIVREWWIRMPTVQAVRYYAFNDSEPRYRYEITGIREVGGQVTRAGPRGGELVALGETGSVEGRVTDHAGAPAAGAEVALEGTIYRSRTDAEGRFVLDDVPQGRYRLAHTSPLLDSLELDGGATAVTVDPGEPIRVEVRLPAPGTLVARACTDPIKADEVGVIRGVVRRTDGMASSTAEVELSWPEHLDIQEVGSGVAVRRATASATLPVDGEGRWMACGLPMDTRITVRARQPEARQAGSAEEIRLGEDDFPMVRLTVPDAVAVADEIEVDDDATPEERRILRELANLGVRREVLGRRFAGPEQVENSREGSMDAVDMVQVLGLPGIRVRTLRSGEVCVHSSRNVRSSFSGGTPEPICAAIVLDGVPVDILRLQSVPGESVAALAYLRSSEAGARFGSGTDGGVLVVWTLRGAG